MGANELEYSPEVRSQYLAADPSQANENRSETRGRQEPNMMEFQSSSATRPNHQPNHD